MMGDGVTKCFLALSGMYCRVYLKKYSPEPGKVLLDNTGDDYIIQHGDEPVEGSYRTAISHTGMKVSEDDTYEARLFAHYTEFTCRVPRNRFEKFHCQRMAYKGHPCFGDYVRPKTIMRASNNVNRVDPRMGRVALLAQESAYMRTSSKDNSVIDIATVIQDITLGLGAEAYIPTFFGGGGKIPPKGYIPSLKPSDARSWILGLAFIAQNPDDSSVKTAQAELFDLQLRESHLHQTHMGENEFVNLTQLVSRIENDPRFTDYEVIPAMAQVEFNVNLSRLCTESPYLCTSQDIAEKLYIYSALYEEIFDVKLVDPGTIRHQVKRPPAHRYFYQFADDVSYQDFNFLARYNRPHSVFLKEVFHGLEIMDLRVPRVDIGIFSHSLSLEQAPEHYKFQKSLREAALSNEVEDWCKIPKDRLNDDGMILLLEKKALEGGKNLMVLTNDIELQNSLKLAWRRSRRFNHLFRDDVPMPDHEVDNDLVVWDEANFDGLDAQYFEGYYIPDIDPGGVDVIRRLTTDPRLPPLTEDLANRQLRFPDRIPALKRFLSDARNHIAAFAS